MERARFNQVNMPKTNYRWIIKSTVLKPDIWRELIKCSATQQPFEHTCLGDWCCWCRCCWCRCCRCCWCWCCWRWWGEGWWRWWWLMMMTYDDILVWRRTITIIIFIQQRYSKMMQWKIFALDIMCVSRLTWQISRFVIL